MTPEEVDRAVQQVKEQNKLDDATFRQALEQQGFTVEAYRKTLKKQILQLKVVNTAVRSRVTVSDDEVKTYYRQNERLAEGDRQAHLRQILVAVPDRSSDADVETKKRVAAKVVELARGGTNFAELAKQYSATTTAPRRRAAISAGSARACWSTRSTRRWPRWSRATCAGRSAPIAAGWCCSWSSARRAT